LPDCKAWLNAAMGLWAELPWAFWLLWLLWPPWGAFCWSALKAAWAAERFPEESAWPRFWN